MTRTRIGAGPAAKLAITVAIFGAAFPILKWGGAGASPLWFAAWRAAICAAVALLVLAGTRRLAWPGRADWAPIVGIGLFQIAGFFTLLQAALVYVPAGPSAVLSYTTGLWTVPISILFLGEVLGMRRLLAVALGLAGVAVIANPWALDWSQPGLLLGHGLLLGAALSWAVAIAVLRASRPVLSTLQLLPFAFTLAACLLFPLAAMVDPHGTTGRTGPTLLALLYVGVLGPLATWAASEVSRQLPAVVSSMGFLAVPVVGLALATLALGEPLSPSLLAGSFLVIAGVAVAARG
jgi:drug/metabolite transporter (DMT)-like permease